MEFKGDRREFKGIEKIIDEHINASFILPLQLNESKDYKYSNSQNDLINKAKNIIEKNKIEFIFSSFLMDNQLFSLDTIETIMELIKIGTLKPLRKNKSII